MNPFLPVLFAVVPVFLIIAAGALLRRFGVLAPAADESLLRLTVFLLVPSLILDSTVGNPSVKELGNVLLAPALGFASVAVGVALGAAAGALLRLPREIRPTFAFTTGLQNYGYIPLPIALLLFDRETLGVLFLFIMGVEAAMWSLAPPVLGEGGFRDGLKKILNPPLLAIALGLLLNFTGADAHFPESLGGALKMLGQCAVPMGLILIGASMTDLAHSFYKKEGGRAMAGSVAVRMALLPTLFIAAAVFLPLSQELRQVLVLQGAMPSAVFSVVLARVYGGHPPTALRVIIATTLVGVIGVPLWIQIGLRAIGGN